MIAALCAVIYLPVEPWLLIRVGVELEPLFRTQGIAGPFERRLGSLGGRAAPPVLDYVLEHGTTLQDTRFLGRVLTRIGEPARVELAARIDQVTRQLDRHRSRNLVLRRHLLNRNLVRRFGDVRYLNLLVEDAVALDLSSTAWHEICRLQDEHDAHAELVPELVGRNGRFSSDFAAYYAEHCIPKGRFPPLRASWLRAQLAQPLERR